MHPPSLSLSLFLSLSLSVSLSLSLSLYIYIYMYIYIYVYMYGVAPCPTSRQAIFSETGAGSAGRLVPEILYNILLCYTISYYIRRPSGP